MHEITTEVEIEATPDRVWSVLMDFDAYPGWNSFVRSIAGVAAKGERLTVSIQPPGGKAETFHPTVLATIPHQEFRWRGRVVLPGIFDGEHYFQIVPISPGRVRFMQGEKFSGLLVARAKPSLDGEIKAGFVAMNQALKARAETGGTR